MASPTAATVRGSEAGFTAFSPLEDLTTLGALLKKMLLQPCRHDTGVLPEDPEVAEEIQRITTLTPCIHCDVCSICLDELRLDESAAQIRELSCGHSFHEACIDKWLRIAGRCPMRCTIVGSSFGGRVEQVNESAASGHASVAGGEGSARAGTGSAASSNSLPEERRSTGSGGDGRDGDGNGNGGSVTAATPAVTAIPTSSISPAASSTGQLSDESPSGAAASAAIASAAAGASAAAAASAIAASVTSRQAVAAASEGARIASRVDARRCPTPRRRLQVRANRITSDQSLA